MTEFLPYQPSRSAVYYHPPARISVHRTVLAFLLSALITGVGAICYAKVEPRLKEILLRCGAAASASVAVGLISLIPVRVGRVQIPAVAAVTGTLLSLATLYLMWAVWVHDVLVRSHVAPIPYSILLLHPKLLLDLMRVMNRVGTWTLNGDIVKGLPLAFFWFVEGGMVLAPGVLFAMKGLVTADPICHGCGSRCKRVHGLPRFSEDGERALAAELENRDFAAIASHAAPESINASEVILKLMSCPKCNEFHVLSAPHIAWNFRSNRRILVRRVVVDQMLITTEEAQELLAVSNEIEKYRTEKLTRGEG